ncbi:transglutaminase domain-containing protein [Aeoliella sp.]|uniref:transglutaminase domain-containing protein n=1 Tax=Aeoliella sp. TaxID=2795800 RepID=UPI003CCC3D0A
MSNRRRHATPLLLLLLLLGVAVVTVGIAGCGQDNRRASAGGRVGQSGANSQRSQTLLSTAANQLSDLPNQAITELRPPRVILDASQSSNSQDVEAMLVMLPNAERPVPALKVTTNNGRFRELGIRPGDLVKWYADQQSELANEFRTGGGQLSAEQRRELMRLPEADRAEVLEQMLSDMQNRDEIVSVSAYEVPVAQVVDSDTLIVDFSVLTEEETGRVPIEAPFRLEIIRYRDSRLEDLTTDIRRYAQRGVPVLGWEPSPDRLGVEQIVERLNQWLRQTSAEVDWQPTELLAGLPQSLGDNEQLQLLASDEALDRKAFSLPTEEKRIIQAQCYEGRLLQEATWARDIGNRVTEGQRDDVGRVDQLFDWLVRHVQLDDPDPNLPPYRPWQSLVHGHATAEGRAWVFAQLCREQDIPMVVLRVGGEQGPLWCGALIDGQLRLYDPRLGLAIQNTAGETATLAEVIENPELLSELDLDDTSYLPDGTKLDELEANIVAGPFALSRRAALLDLRLAGDDSLLLSVDADELAKTLKETPGISSAVLWPYPYQVIANQLDLSRNTRVRATWEFEPFVHKPLLWKARLLSFRGSRGQSIDANRGNLQTAQHDLRDAGRAYLNGRVRPTDDEIAAIQSEDANRAWTAAKENATYWQGLLSYDRGDYDVSSSWMTRAADSQKWRDGAVYNRARALEATGEPGNVEEARKLLESSEGPQAVGNRLRAKRMSAAKPNTDEAKPDDKLEAADAADSSDETESTDESE